ncbi:MAG: hypothetical protein BMS9Abin37_2488 [Acidobacteriota bacterium]|nr:MAG: hypothetical protein BMS9Abin37_2488 [Acidobacteriota bacterium]
MRGSWKAGGIAVLLTLVSVTLAYQLPAVLELDLGRNFPSALAIENFHDTEQGYRWTRAESRIVFRDPGGFRDALVELELSGFRPPSPEPREPPLVVIEAAGESVQLRPGRRRAWHSLETRTSGWWSSDVVVLVRSQTFSPGAGDDRALGVRIHRVRLTTEGPAWTAPPLRQLLSSVMIVVLGFLWFRRRSKRFATATAAGVVLAGGFAFARGTTALFVPIVAAILVALTLVRVLTPSVARFADEVCRAAARSLVENMADFSRGRSAVLAILTVSGVWASYRLTPHVDIDLGSGAATEIAQRFGPLDRDGAVTFRRARVGATLDLKDFGSGAPWRIVIHASGTSTTSGVVATTAGHHLEANVTPAWARYQLDVPASSLGWRSGHVLTFPGLGAGTELRIDRVELERGESTPSLHSLVLVLVATLLVAAALRSSAAGGIFVLFVTTALLREPVVTLPSLPSLLLGAIAVLCLGACARGFLEVAARRKFLPELAPFAISMALGGFVLWFAALASPLYVGGHYGFHTNIAEEIWQGRFLHYYLPYPGSMLSRQPQWNNLIVPHSCLFHTLVAPFAALPRTWFHLFTNFFLASLLAGISLTSALVATRVGSARAGMYAAFASVFVPTGFQLLGLGHLMTLFGTWASTLALGFIVIHIDELRERAVYRWALALLSLCFVSYTGSLLFASLTLVAACVLFYARHAALAKRLASLIAIAWGVSFLLYYIHWSVPFVRDSLPELVSRSGAGGGIDLLARVSAQPGKLAYTFGAALVPLIGLAGLSRARGERRVVLACWAGILIAFSAFDVLFNFLLKHHYFTYPVIAVGIGLALGWLHEKGWLGRAITALFVVSLVWMGLQEAVAVAQGTI